MRKIIRYTIVTVSVLLLIVAGLLFHAGLAVKVKMDEKQMGPYYTVYQSHQGGYHKNGRVIDEISAMLNDENIDPTLSFGHYFDNPFTGDTKIRDLRSHAGVVVNSDIFSSITTIAAGHGFQSKEIPMGNYLVIELPFRSQFSKITGPLKVYPKIAKRLEQQGLAMVSLVEIFDEQNSRILYLSPIPDA